MRIGIIGTSAIAGHFITGARLAGGIEIAAVYSRRAETGEAFAHTWGIPLVYTRLDDLATSAAVDAVYIASPNVFHYPQSRQMLESGKHVLCEKPIVTAPEQFEQLRALAEERGLIYMEAIMIRYLPARESLHRAVAELGRVTTARFDFSQLSSRYPALLRGELPNIFNPAMAAGSLMDLGVYCVYPAVDLFGEPEGVRASAGFLSTGADGFGSACLSYPEREVLLSWSKIGQGYAGSEILGDQGSITIRSISTLTGVELHLADGTHRMLCGALDKAAAMCGEAKAFRHFVQAPEQYRAAYEQASSLTGRVCRVMEQIRHAAGISFETP